MTLALITRLQGSQSFVLNAVSRLWRRLPRVSNHEGGPLLPALVPGSSPGQALRDGRACVRRVQTRPHGAPSSGLGRALWRRLPDPARTSPGWGTEAAVFP